MSSSTTTTTRPWADNVPDWAASLPTPKSNPPQIEPSEVAQLIRTKKAGVDFLIVDLRREDWKTAFIHTAINLPAQSFHQSLPGLVPILQRVPIVVFYCKACAITARGPRIAAWYQDALDTAGIKTSTSHILTGGIEEWVSAYGDAEDLTVKI